MKFKVGDKVRVREDLEVGERYDYLVTPGMVKYRGEVIEIGDKYSSYYIQKGSAPYAWTDEMLEPIDHPLTTKVEERNNKPSRQVELDNSKANRHERLMNHLNEVYRVKNKDYGDAFGKSHEKYGAIAGLTRINDKFNRLEELILSGEQLVEDETVLDTLLDLANYSIMLYMELEK